MKGNEPFCSVADPDPDRANQTPARADAVTPPTAVPEVPAAAANYAATETSAAASEAASDAAATSDAAAASGATAAASAAAAAATTPGLCGRVSGRDQQTRHANGGKTIDTEQRGCCQTAR